MNEEDELDEYPMFGVGSVLTGQGPNNSKYPMVIILI
jgi:hypothetical protein